MIEETQTLEVAETNIQGEETDGWNKPRNMMQLLLVERGANCSCYVLLYVVEANKVYSNSSRYDVCISRYTVYCM